MISGLANSKTAGLLLTLLAMAACGGAGESPTQGGPAAASFNQADMDFAVAMSMHRGQAFTLAEVAENRTANPTVRRILARIRATDAAAVDQIAGWLQEWAGPEIDIPHDHGYGDTKPGMLSESQMSRVARAHTKTFDDILLTALIAHHRAAIPLLERQLANGRSIEARAMAQELAVLYRAELGVLQRAAGRSR